MKFIVCLTIAFLLIPLACQNPKKEVNLNQTIQVQNNSLNDHQKYLIQEFKKNFLYKCLKVGYNNEEIKTCLKDDHSLAGDFPLGIKGYRMVDSLALLYRDLIVKDSILLADRHPENPDYAGAKRVIQVCLNAYNSEIDSIARKRYGN